MFIKKVIITNFKCYKDPFEIEFNEGVNIIVGNNETGKSTILDAINLALTGYLDGKHISFGINQYIFNKQSVEDYIDSLNNSGDSKPPKITIEVFLGGDTKELASYAGDNHSNSGKTGGESGFRFHIEIDEELFKETYEELIMSGGFETLPVEFYRYYWTTFSREEYKTTSHLPIKSILIDSTNYGNRNSSDMYISRIIKGTLTPNQIVKISQAHRKLKENFQDEKIIKDINEDLDKQTNLTGKKVNLGIDLGTRNSWEENMLTEIDSFPFQHIGKGLQSLLRIDIALAAPAAKNAAIILLEEPENHLSHTNLNKLINRICDKLDDKQIICSTHSSFVANKLGIKNLILLENKNVFKFGALSQDSQDFFNKLPGYDTLRLILCNKAILVEGPSDELVLQKAYLDKHGKLPIEDQIEVLSVGTTFLRFLEIAKELKKLTCVVTDNDGHLKELKKKYSDYIGENKKEFINICFDESTHTDDDLGLGDINHNTLEPNLIRSNDLNTLNEILGQNFTTVTDLAKHMLKHKTSCALSLFHSDIKINYPDYINEAIR